MYTITVRRIAQGQEEDVYSPIKDYEIEGGMLTLAFDENHDLVIPLFHVSTVDIARQE